MPPTASQKLAASFWLARSRFHFGIVVQEGARLPLKTWAPWIPLAAMVFNKKNVGLHNNTWHTDR